MTDIGFSPAEILLPHGAAYETWSVVACDQYTSQPEYWNGVERFVGDTPSTLRLTLPEAYLSAGDVDKRVAAINETMRAYLAQGLLRSIGSHFVYVERTLRGGAVRSGLVGMVDLERYDYHKGSQSLIRATEGTVLERIPPRVRVREGAALELPHIMLLIDDPSDTVLGPLKAQSAGFPTLYDFDLMQQSGHLKGFQVQDAAAQGVNAALAALGDPAAFEEKYGVKDKGVLLFAVGDGNHSLATAKECYEQLKKRLPENEWKNHPARYALVELNNVHDPALEFEPIHRVAFDVEPQALLRALGEYYDISFEPCKGQSFEFLAGGERRRVWVKNPPSNLAVGTLQAFLDDYTAKHGGTVDYIHGEDVVEQLSGKPGNAGFLLPAMQKSELFPTVILDGALPRKTFSMGNACDKRFYLESRRITR